MAYVLALPVFVALSAACRLAPVAGHRGIVASPDPSAPDYPATTTASVGVTSPTSFIPFPLGYLVGLVVWAVAALGGLGLTAGLFGYSAVSSFAARLVVLGAMHLFGI